MGGGLGETTRAAPHAAEYSRVSTIDARCVVVFQPLVLATMGFEFRPARVAEKLPIGGRMGHRVGSKLCPLCHRLEDHEQVLRH